MDSLRNAAARGAEAIGNIGAKSADSFRSLANKIADFKFPSLGELKDKFSSESKDSAPISTTGYMTSSATELSNKIKNATTFKELEGLSQELKKLVENESKTNSELPKDTQVAGVLLASKLMRQEINSEADKISDSKIREALDFMDSKFPSSHSSGTINTVEPSRDETKSGATELLNKIKNGTTLKELEGVSQELEKLVEDESKTNSGLSKDTQLAGVLLGSKLLKHEIKSEEDVASNKKIRDVLEFVNSHIR